MSYELIITEKPQAAKKIAAALADATPKKESHNKVPYYRITHHGKEIVVASAVGHLFSVSEKNKGKWEYPIFDIEWVQSSKVQKASAFTSKYVTVLRKLSKGADSFTVACDFDVEGEVIGYNVIKHIAKKKDARRMKFSTLTTAELRQSYENALPTLEWGQVNAGVTRHELDWYYGINLSRALTLAVKSTGGFKILSSGRVQGPALKIIVDKEKEIQSFTPVPFWQIELDGNLNAEKVSALHKEDKFWDETQAKASFDKANGHDGNVTDVKKNQFNQSAPTPFDLTTLQTEAYRSLRYQPKKTLELAQELYIAGLISYPRTSSQKLPEKLGFKDIMKKLANQQFYKELCERLLTKGHLKPNEGKKSDPAHPAIYPTGNISAIDGQAARLYDLIVRRFLATFASHAVRETVSLIIDVNSEEFIAKGTRTVEPGWHRYYGTHVKLEEETMPNASKGDAVAVKKMDFLSKETQPPKRYTPASIIRELEKRELGTKATRAAIVENLFNRGYVEDTSIKATALGINTADTLEKYSPMIVDEELTKHFEELMQQIREKGKEPSEVLSEAREKLTEILRGFREHEKDIGAALAKALSETRAKQTTVGKCPHCDDGKLAVRKGKFGSFIACSNYPECKNTISLPKGRIKVTEKMCKDCGYPQVIISRGKRPQQVCINKACPSKEVEGEAAQEAAKVENGDIEKKCAKCGKPMKLRQSIYGKFYGCSGFPKCRNTEKIENGK